MKSKPLWLCFVMVTIAVAGVAILTLTPVPDGPGALTALKNVPNYVALLLCFFAAIVCVIRRPRPPRD